MTRAIFALAFVALLAVAGCAALTGDWRKDLTAEGWTEVALTLDELRDTTWYGQPRPGRSFAGYVYYFRPDGERGLLRAPYGRVYIDHLRQTDDGRICHRIEALHDGKQLCVDAIWHRDGLFMFTDSWGRALHSWTRVPGNPEDL